jgi:hypothetical protein
VCDDSYQNDWSLNIANASPPSLRLCVMIWRAKASELREAWQLSPA